MVTRVLLAASSNFITNGYSIVAYSLAKHLATKKDIELTYYGFQYFQKNPAHEKERELPSNVQIYDCFENENPKGLGFGFDQFADFVTMNKPDVIIIYNDMVVVANLLEKLTKVQNKNFKVIVYIDQVYLYQKKHYIELLNAHADYVLCFTPYWEDIARGLGIKRPTGFLQHGFDPMTHYPVPQNICRDYYNLKQDDFIVLSLNRNQPRKRYDILLQTWAEFVSRHLEEPVKLLIATALNGGWSIIEVYERELWKRGITLEQGLKHVIFIDNPQNVLDEEINILMNLGDINLTEMDGEGWGLTNYQSAALGKPQVTSYVGGIKDFFTRDNSMILEPKMTFYIDQSRDSVGGEAELVDYRDAVEALEAYYADPDLRKLHGDRCRKGILEKYQWPVLGDKLYNIIKEVAAYPTFAMRDALEGKQAPAQAQIQGLQITSSQPQPAPAPVSSANEVKPINVKKTESTNGKISLDDIAALLGDIPGAELKMTPAATPPAATPPVATPPAATPPDSPNIDVKNLLTQEPAVPAVPTPVPVVPVVPTPEPAVLEVPTPETEKTKIQVVEEPDTDTDTEAEAEAGEMAFDIEAIKKVAKKPKKKKQPIEPAKNKADEIKQRLQDKLANKKLETQKEDSDDDDLDVEALLKLKSKIDKLIAKSK
jgi:glycosyltransferase involved in cell wall biosynthesis